MTAHRKDGHAAAALSVETAQAWFIQRYWDGDPTLPHAEKWRMLAPSYALAPSRIPEEEYERFERCLAQGDARRRKTEDDLREIIARCNAVVEREPEWGAPDEYRDGPQFVALAQAFQGVYDAVERFSAVWPWAAEEPQPVGPTALNAERRHINNAVARWTWSVMLKRPQAADLALAAIALEIPDNRPCPHRAEFKNRCKRWQPVVKGWAKGMTGADALATLRKRRKQGQTR